MQSMLVIHGWDAAPRRVEVGDEVSSVALMPHVAFSVSTCGALTIERKVLGPTTGDAMAEALKTITIHQLYACEAFILVEDKLGQLWALGLNIIDGDISSIPLPRLLEPKFQATVVACGRNHCLVVADSHCFAIGQGEHGELGLGSDLRTTTTLQKVFIPSEREATFRSVGAGAYHSLFVTNPNGHVFSCGSGSYGRLGQGENDAALYVPTLLSELLGVGEPLVNGRSSGIGLVGCGLWHSVAVAVGTGDVFGWGWNNFGQLGPLSEEGTDPRKEELLSQPTRIAAIDDFIEDDQVVGLHCGSRFTCLHTASNKLVMMGEVGASSIPGLLESHTAERLDWTPRVLEDKPTRKRKTTDATPARPMSVSSSLWAIAYIWC